jgi:hypothetical protein
MQRSYDGFQRPKRSVAIQPKDKKLGTQLRPNQMKLKYTEKINLSFPHEIKKEILKQSNLFHLGVEDCNKWCEKTNRYVAAFPEKETPELKETHWKSNAGFVIGLEIEVDPVTAEIVNVIWKKRK